MAVPSNALLTSHVPCTSTASEAQRHAAAVGIGIFCPCLPPLCVSPQRCRSVKSRNHRTSRVGGTRRDRWLAFGAEAAHPWGCNSSDTWCKAWLPARTLSSVKNGFVWLLFRSPPCAPGVHQGVIRAVASCSLRTGCPQAVLAGRPLLRSACLPFTVQCSALLASVPPCTCIGEGQPGHCGS